MRIKKVLLYILEGILVVGIFLGVYMLLSKSNIHIPKTIELKKYGDFNHEVSQIIDELKLDKDGYLPVVSYMFDSKGDGNYFTVYKDGKIVYDENESVVKVDESDELYIRITDDKDETYYSLVDYKNKGYTDKKYYILDYVGRDTFIAANNNKYALIDKYGKELLPFEYKYIENFDLNGKYVFVVKGKKVGVYDLTGKEIVPLKYDYKVLDPKYDDSYDCGSIVKIDNNYFFIMKKDNVYYLINEEGKILLKNNSEIRFNYYLEYFEVINKKSVDFYGKDGILLNEFKLTSDMNYLRYETYTSYIDDNQDFIIIPQDFNDSTVYVLDKNFNLKKIDNAFFETMYEDYNSYYINKDIYITEFDGDHTIYKFTDDSKIGEYKKVIYGGILTDEKAMFVCKNKKSDCTAMDLKGKTLFNESLDYFYDKENFTYYLNKDNKYIIDYASGTMLTCEKEGFEKIKYLATKVRNNLFYGNDDNLYDKTCKKVSDKLIRNVYSYDNYVVAELDNGDDEEAIYDYLIYDKDNKALDIKNPDNVKTLIFMGNVDNDYYFLTDKGIYYVSL